MSIYMCERCGEVATVTSEAGRFCSKCDEINEMLEETPPPPNYTSNRRIFYMIIGYGWVCFIPSLYTCPACGKTVGDNEIHWC